MACCCFTGVCQTEWQATVQPWRQFSNPLGAPWLPRFRQSLMTNVCLYSTGLGHTLPTCVLWARASVFITQAYLFCSLYPLQRLPSVLWVTEVSRGQLHPPLEEEARERNSRTTEAKALPREGSHCVVKSGPWSAQWDESNWPHGKCRWSWL